MTDEEKELLTKDLCCRLDNLSLLVKYGGEDYNIIGIGFGRVTLVKPLMSMTSGSPLIEEVKPYLRPMDSMTEEEKVYQMKLIKDIKHGANIDKLEDFYHSHLFDYRGLIPMGLALEATEDMYQHLK